MHCFVIRVSQKSCLCVNTFAVSQLNIIFLQLCMHNKHKNETLIGTIKDTQMKWSDGGHFPIFEVHTNNGTKSMISIECLTDVQNKTIFKFDSSIPSDSKNFVSMKIAIILLIMIEHICKLINICSILS